MENCKGSCAMDAVYVFCSKNKLSSYSLYVCKNCGALCKYTHDSVNNITSRILIDTNNVIR